MRNDELADRVWDAMAARKAIPPLTNDVPDLTVDAAYDIQDELIARHEAAGARIVAAKLGLTSRAKQQQMNVEEPLYGWLTDAMDLSATGQIPMDRFIQPRVEPEIALKTNADLAGPGVVTAQVLAATEWVAPALDVLDSRFTGYRFTLADVTADNASAAGFVLGEPTKDYGDLRLTGCTFDKNGDLVATAAGAAVMEHPAGAVAWFVRKLHERGRTLPAGSVVLAGGWTAAVAIDSGDMIRAEFDRIGVVEAACL